MRCIHEWKVLDKTVLPSIIEQCAGDMRASSSIFAVAGRKKVVVVVTCPKCGAIKTFVESNP